MAKKMTIQFKYYSNAVSTMLNRTKVRPRHMVRAANILWCIWRTSLEGKHICSSCKIHVISGYPGRFHSCAFILIGSMQDQKTEHNVAYISTVFLC